jgi:hypothetical protein
MINKNKLILKFPVLLLDFIKSQPQKIKIDILKNNTYITLPSNIINNYFDYIKDLKKIKI